MKTVVYVQPTSEVGGSDIALLRLVSHLDRKAYRPLAVLPSDGPLVSRLQAAGCGVVIQPMMQLRSLRNAGYQAAYLARFWPTVFALTGLIRREHADLVHTNSLFGLYGAWAALLARVPHVWHVREIPQLPVGLVRPLTAMAMRLSARVIAMTDAVARLFERESVSSGKVLTIPDGIDLQAFHPRVHGGRIRGELKIPAGAPLIGFVGRLDPWKGADVFIRAAAEIAKQRPDARFLVCGGELVGYQAYATQLEQLAGALGLAHQIHFTGWRYRLDDIPEVMAAMDVLLHTSVRPEPFGLVLVEAMATGKPVVASKAGGVLEVVDPNVTGLLARPGDWREVADGALRLIREPATAEAMGRAGRRRAERLFEVGAYARKIEALYGSVLESRVAVRA